MIAEYLALTDVTGAEVRAIETEARGLSNREIAIAFRMSEMLDIPYPFNLAPRYQPAFLVARAAVHALHDEPQAQPEVL